MKIYFLIIGIFFLQNVNGQTPKHILNSYDLVWIDNFEGVEIDTSKWDYRVTGTKRKIGIVSEKNSYLDGDGHLIIEVSKKDSLYYIGQIGSQDKFSVQYGYFECRAKMNKQLGPHVAFWLQSPYISEEKDNPQQFGTEIDIFEYHIKNGDNIIYHSLHWNGYGKKHKQIGTYVTIDNINKGYHTFGLEWTSKEYIFYVDGIETWRTNEAISNIPEYMILSAELSGWGGNFSRSEFPDKVIFDFVKVYKKTKTTGNK